MRQYFEERTNDTMSPLAYWETK